VRRGQLPSSTSEIVRPCVAIAIGSIQESDHLAGGRQWDREAAFIHVGLAKAAASRQGVRGRGTRSPTAEHLRGGPGC